MLDNFLYITNHMGKSDHSKKEQLNHFHDALASSIGFLYRLIFWLQKYVLSKKNQWEFHLLQIWIQNLIPFDNFLPENRFEPRIRRTRRKLKLLFYNHIKRLSKIWTSLFFIKWPLMIKVYWHLKSALFWQSWNWKHKKCPFRDICNFSSASRGWFLNVNASQTCQGVWFLCVLPYSYELTLIEQWSNDDNENILSEITTFSVLLGNETFCIKIPVTSREVVFKSTQ